MEKYELLERIGEGTFGEVHKARHVSTGNIVAMKRVRLRTLDEKGIEREQTRLWSVLCDSW